MIPRKGPVYVSRERRVAARTPPLVKPGVPAEVLRKYMSDRPLRRPLAAGQHLPEEPLPITRAAVDQAIAAAEQGNTVDVREEGRALTLRIMPAVCEELQQRGLSPDEMKRFLDRLWNALGSEGAVAKLPQVSGMPGVRVYTTVAGRLGAVYVYRLVLTELPESATVLVVSCFSRRESSL